MEKDNRDLQLLELKDTITQLRGVIQTLQDTIAAGQKRETALQEQIDYLTKKLFGTSSEKHAAPLQGQMSLFDEEEPADPETLPLETEVVVREHRRRPKRTLEEKFKGIPVEEVIVDDLTREEKTCPDRGREMVPVGRQYDHQELLYVPAQVKVIKYYSRTYGCPKCKEEAEVPVFVKSKVPPPLLKHSFASPSAVAWTMYQKYVNAVPLYQQEKDWVQYGAELSRTTLGNWIIDCAEKYLQPLYGYFHRELLKRRFAMADETRIQVLKEPGRRPQTDSFMWLFRSGEDGKPQIVLYRYTETRAGYNAKEFLKGFSGYLMTDGYSGYNELPEVTRCCCWAHVRRYFVDAVPTGKESDMSVPAVQGVAYCDKLFTYERRAKERGDTPKQRYNWRLKKEKPVIDAFFAWLEAQHPDRGTRMSKAVNYVLNRKPYLVTYLEDGRCSFSNNPSENAIRPFTVGRKNWLFSDTPDGATASAVIYTIVEMAKAHKLNVYRYLCYLLTKRPDKCWSDTRLSKLAPWDPDVMEVCRNDCPER